jgi:prophage antirepressor-like protein
MNEEIKTDNNCIVKAFENNPIAILNEDINNKKVYYFKASDIGKVLGILNIRQSIQNYDDDERVVRKVYDPYGTLQDTIFLSSQGVYRLLYNSKKEIAKKFRKWAGNILDDIIFNESIELRKQLEDQQKLLEEKEQLLIENAKLINELELKPETEGFSSRVPGEIYCIRDTTKYGHMKIGIADKTITRVDQLNVGSSTHSLKLYTKFNTFDRNLAEKLIHHSLHPFRIKNRHDESTRFDSSAWFYFRNDHELAYAMNTIKKSLEYIKQFDIKNIVHFRELTLNLDINEELIKPEITQDLQLQQQNKMKEHVEKINKKNKNNIQQSGAQTGNFKGACWVKDKKMWKSQIRNNNKNYHLGYFSDEIDAAKAYNDYALYLNEHENANFLLNDITGYKTVARNVVELNKLEQLKQKTSIYNGVSYDSKRKYYVVSIKLSGKTYNLGSSLYEIECAKLYNQQALFFNNQFNTNYILNDIPNYITEPKDFREDIKPKKTSKYHGVSLTSQNKWTCSYMLNRKKIHIGTFNTELEACEAYNNVIIELNKNGCNYKVNNLA